VAGLLGSPSIQSPFFSLFFWGGPELLPFLFPLFFSFTTMLPDHFGTSSFLSLPAFFPKSRRRAGVCSWRALLDGVGPLSSCGLLPPLLEFFEGLPWLMRGFAKRNLLPLGGFGTWFFFSPSFFLSGGSLLSSGYFFPLFPFFVSGRGLGYCEDRPLSRLAP